MMPEVACCIRKQQNPVLVQWSLPMSDKLVNRLWNVLRAGDADAASIPKCDRCEAPYADGKYLCAVCRVEYMDLHHADPFRVINPKEASV